MEGVGWFSFLVIGVIAGWLAEKIMDRDHGLFTNLIVGVVGAYLGAFLFDAAGLTASAGFWGALIVSTVGAVALLALVGLVRGRRR